MATQEGITIEIDRKDRQRLRRILRDHPFYREAVTETLIDMARDAGAMVVDLTPAPGFLEPPGGRKWRRTGNARRSIHPGIQGQDFPDNQRTATRFHRPYTRVVYDAVQAPYISNWLERGYRDDPRYGRVTMKVRKGGYRMFATVRKRIAGTFTAAALAKCAQKLMREWGIKT